MRVVHAKAGVVDSGPTVEWEVILEEFVVIGKYLLLNIISTF